MVEISTLCASCGPVARMLRANGLHRTLVSAARRAGLTRVSGGTRARVCARLCATAPSRAASSVADGSRAAPATAAPAASSTPPPNGIRPVPGGMFRKLAIVNRGEIACRIARTAARMGVKTVAVYSDADRASQHVAMADEAYYIGPSPSSESYLRGDFLAQLAASSGCEAVHPGYGFLSESASFAAAVTAAGVAFVGPPVHALKEMGSKARSKEIMTAAGVPVTPGYWGEDQSVARMGEAAKAMGYPVMVKAVRGGGGKGMRVVRRPEDLPAALESCQREAASSFGDSRVLVEKFIERPRHVELQVFADAYGDAVYLWERDCSVQRRHQKVLEEAPAPGLPRELREKMGTAAVNAAKAVGYVGAGTVEFMVDTDGSFYFMEMNTRLQVEHPVTEMITELDLVEWQLRVAAGQRLPLTQKDVDVRVRGHAIEARVYAENPSNNFLPATGVLKHLLAPTQSEYVRVDTGVRQGDAVSIFYDPMISKLIVWGHNREDALRRMRVALAEYQVVGLPNNIEFLQRTLSHPGFVAGGVDTSFLAHHLPECLPVPTLAPPEAVMLAGAATALRQQREAFTTSAVAAAASANDAFSPWTMGTSARPAMPASNAVTLPFHDDVGASVHASATKTDAPATGSGKHSKRAPAVHPHHAHAFCVVARDGSSSAPSVARPVRAVNGGKDDTLVESFTITVGHGPSTKSHAVIASSTPVNADIAASSALASFRRATQGRAVAGVHADAVTITVDGKQFKATVVTVDGDVKDSGREVHVFPRAGPSFAAHSYRFTLPATPVSASSSSRSAAQVVTPMPGKVVKVLAAAGTEVKEGAPVMILEAMKMEHVIKAPITGVLATVNYKAGEFVEDGKVLVTFETKKESK